MGELARKRKARDLWISRGHLWAAALGVVVIAVGAFFAGAAILGREPVGAAPATARFDAQLTDESLVDLLARVEASADIEGEVGALTFPEVLEGGGPEVAVPVGPDPVVPVIEIVPDQGGLSP